MTEFIETQLTPEQIAEREAWNSPEAVYEREYAEVQRQRESAYRAESDVLRDYYLRGENSVTKEDWLAKIAEIRERYPYPVKP